MDLRLQSRIGIVALALVALSAPSLAGSRAAGLGLPGRQRSAGAGNGFLDFTLRRINPSDKDYGKFIERKRAVLIQETVRNRYFWSNLVALCALACLVIIIIFQHQSARRREGITADMLAQFEHSLRRSRALTDEAVQKNRALKEAMARVQESRLQFIPVRSDSGEIGDPSAANPRAFLGRAAMKSPTRTSSLKTAALHHDDSSAAIEPASQMTLFKADAAIIMKVNALEQQLVRAEEQKRELRRQLNETRRKLEAEQEKIRDLKVTVPGTDS